MLSIAFIGIGLAMDAFAISVSGGLTARDFKLRHALLFGLYFGGFQFLMPLAGYCLAGTVSVYVSRFGPYISFVLLAFIGGRMIWGAVAGGEPGNAAAARFGHGRLLALAVATSIDALAVGVSFVFMDVSIIPACAVIGAVTFAICVFGGALGRYIPWLTGNRAEIAGGLILVAIGVKLLAEGVFAL